MDKQTYDWNQDIAPYLHTMQPVDGGYSTATRGVVTLNDGTKVFVKIAEGETTIKWLQKEVDVYVKLNAAGYPYIPKLLACSDDHHAMAIEYLAHANFENIWDEGKLGAIITAQDDLKKYAYLFADDPSYTLESVVGRESKWTAVMAPGAVERLNEKFAMLSTDIILESAQLETYQKTLVGWKMREDTLVHQDIRADNFAYNDATHQGLLVDWNWLCMGDASLDTTPLFVNMYIAGFDPYAIHPEAYDAHMLIYMLSFWLERILASSDNMDADELKRRRAQAQSVKATLELLHRSTIR